MTPSLGCRGWPAWKESFGWGSVMVGVGAVTTVACTEEGREDP